MLPLKNKLKGETDGFHLLELTTKKILTAILKMIVKSNDEENEVYTAVLKNAEVKPSLIMFSR